MRVVLDTNVLASGALAASPGTIDNLFLRLRRGAFELLLCRHILDELEATLDKPYFVARMTRPHRLAFTEAIASRGTVIQIDTVVSGVATQPADDIVLATGVAGHADYLVTGDLQLQRLGNYQGVVILSPADFVAILSAERESGAT